MQNGFENIKIDATFDYLIPAEEVKRLLDLASKGCKAKEIESQKPNSVHHKDKKNNSTRWNTGMLCEGGVQYMLNFKFMDETFSTDAKVSKKYDKPDIWQYNCGIKGVEWGKYPLISVKNTYPQVIVFLMPEDYRKEEANGGRYIRVAGIATPTQLNTYQNDDMVINKDVLGRKTAFTGIDKIEITPETITHQRILTKYFLSKICGMKKGDTIPFHK